MEVETGVQQGKDMHTHLCISLMHTHVIVYSMWYHKRFTEKVGIKGFEGSE